MLVGSSSVANRGTGGSSGTGCGRSYGHVGSGTRGANGDGCTRRGARCPDGDDRPGPGCPDSNASGAGSASRGEHDS